MSSYWLVACTKIRMNSSILIHFVNDAVTGFVRDHLRYVDEIICAAARVVEAVRKHARKNTKHKPSMEDGIYDAMHVR